MSCKDQDLYLDQNIWKPSEILRENLKVKLKSLDDRPTSFHYCNIMNEPPLSLNQTKLSTSEEPI